MKTYKTAWPLLLLVLSAVSIAQENQWQPVIGANNLSEFVSGRTVSWKLGLDPESRGEYRADGTGTLYAWGTEFEREWNVNGNDQICFSGEPESQCYTLEKSTSDPALYRVTEVITGDVTEIREVKAENRLVADSTGGSKSGPDQGGPATPSAGELSTKLLNPANPIMKIGNNFDYIKYDGDLPGASEQTSFRYVFQTVFPFKLDNGNTVMFRPAIPLIFDQGIPNASGGYDDVGTDFADMGYDLIYTGTTDKGTIWGVGARGGIPIASDDRLGQNLWGLGPEVMFGKAGKWGAVGGVLGHQWDVAGSGDGDINLTTLNYFYGFTLKNGWAITAAPVVSYKHEARSGQELTLPIGIGVSKTAILGGRPWQFRLQYSNNVVRPDAFAAEHTIRIGIFPIVSAPWNKGK